MDPEPLAAIDHDPVLAQQRQVPGDFRLRLLERVRQLTHAQLTLGGEEQQQAQPCLIGQGGEEGERFEGHGQYIRQMIYTVKRIFN